MHRFTSRKFLLCLAAFLGSIGASIAALQTQNQKLVAFGLVCAILSAAIYAAAEAYVDGKAVLTDFEVDDVEDFDVDNEDDEDDEDEIKTLESDVPELDQPEVETRANIEKKEA